MTKNFWKGTRRKEASKFTLFIFRSFQKKKKRETSSKKEASRRRREVPSGKSFSPFSRQKLLRTSFHRWGTEIGVLPEEKRFGLEKDFSGEKKGRKERKGEIEERDEGVAKRLEPNWNST